MEQRYDLMINWLKEVYPVTVDQIVPASSDASHRRYYRLTLTDQTFIIMDAPPNLEDCRPFVYAQEQLYQVGVPVPDIFLRHMDLGFLLLTDFGSETFLDRVLNRPDEAQDWYLKALKLLIPMQVNSKPGVFPDYSYDLLRREISLFPDWYITHEKKTALPNKLTEAFQQVTDQLIHSILQQPKVWVHRDYHSRNLMIHNNQLGVIDFQDAVYGPITYDAVSLLRDAYISWPEEQQLDWLIRYWQDLRKVMPSVTDDFYQFYRDFEMMAIQRHLKVVGIFARLAHRDNKLNYLADIPRVWAYLRSAVSRYAELAPLLQVLDYLDQGSLQTGYTF